MMWNMIRPARWYTSILIALLCAGCAAPADVVVTPTQVPMDSAPASATGQVVSEATPVELPAEPTMLVPTPSAAVPTREATSTASVVATAVVTSELQVLADPGFAQPLADIGTAFGRVVPGMTIVVRPAEVVEGQELAGDADVVITNAPATVDALVGAGRAVSETVRVVARDRLVVVVPPPETAIVRTLQDLGKPGVRVVAATNDVAAGAAAAAMIERSATDSSYGDAFKNAVQANLAVTEPDAASVLRKVVFGEADAGILYSSEIVDVLAERTGRVSIPDALNTVRTTTVVPITGSNDAQPFVDYLFTPEAQEILAGYGYEPAGGTAEIPSPEGVLEITGEVASTLTLTREDLEQYPQVDVPAEVTGGAEGYRGPRLADLLSAAGAATSAQTVVFVAADGTTSERSLEELLGRFDVLVALLADDRLQIIDPRLDEPVALDNVVRVEVK